MFEITGTLVLQRYPGLSQNRRHADMRRQMWAISGHTKCKNLCSRAWKYSLVTLEHYVYNAVRCVCLSFLSRSCYLYKTRWLNLNKRDPTCGLVDFISDETVCVGATAFMVLFLNMTEIFFSYFLFFVLCSICKQWQLSVSGFEFYSLVENVKMFKSDGKLFTAPTCKLWRN